MGQPPPSSRLCKQLQFQLMYLEEIIPFFRAPGADPRRWTTQLNEGQKTPYMEGIIRFNILLWLSFHHQ